MRLTARVRLVALAALLCSLVAASSAQAALTTAQKATLKAAILADPALNAFPNNSDGNFDLAAKLSTELASPAFIVWRTNVPIGEVGRTFNATELAGLTSLNTQRLQNLAAWLQGGVNPSLSSIRQFFDDVFSGAGGTNTRAALLVIWKRSATLVEKIFATGTGTTAAPATMGYEGAISASDVADARNS